MIHTPKRLTAREGASSKQRRPPDTFDKNALRYYSGLTMTLTDGLRTLPTTLKLVQEY